MTSSVPDWSQLFFHNEKVLELQRCTNFVVFSFFKVSLILGVSRVFSKESVITSLIPNWNHLSAHRIRVIDMAREIIVQIF